MSKYLRTHICPITISPGISVSNLLEEMSNISFQGKNLGLATKIWSEMLRGKTTIFFGLAGAMVPAGMRKLLVYLIENRMIDCLVSTGANLFHDLHETLGNFHWQGSTQVCNNELRKEGIHRIYDVFVRSSEFLEADRLIGEFSESLDQNRAYTSREYFFLLGKRLLEIGKEEGILISAAKADLPIYCPALVDSGFGLALGAHRIEKGGRLLFDLVKDVTEMGRIVTSAKNSGTIFVGGGTPKNFVQQAGILYSIMGQWLPGHKYAIQITTDSPHWGGLSGSTFEEAQSWGKIDQQARKVTVYCDATVALPFLVTAVAERNKENLKKRSKPIFLLGEELEMS